MQEVNIAGVQKLLQLQVIKKSDSPSSYFSREIQYRKTKFSERQVQKVSSDGWMLILLFKTARKRDFL